MCFSNRRSSSSTTTPAPTPADPGNAPAANPTEPRQRVISSTSGPASNAADPLGQGQLGG